ncbi:MAG: SRPBCC family protein [Betaproteobacteria bacterium]
MLGRAVLGCLVLVCANVWAQTDTLPRNPPSSVEGVTVTARRDGEAVLVEARAQLQCGLRVAWSVLTDYGRYPDFIPDMKTSRIVARTGNFAVVEQTGEAGFFLFHFPISVTLDVTEVEGASVSSRASAGTFREMTGIYRLVESPDGLWLTYSGRMVPSFALPPLVGVPALRAVVNKQFSALVREIARRGKDAAASGAPQ